MNEKEVKLAHYCPITLNRVYSNGTVKYIMIIRKRILRVDISIVGPTLGNYIYSYAGIKVLNILEILGN